MEADWEFELGEGAPVIDAAWSGFVDLRCSPQRATDLTETHALPALAEVLVRLNQPRSSPVWTAKCDVWVPESIDPYELDAPPGVPLSALACYVDLLPRSDQQWNTPSMIEQACHALCTRLRAVPLRCCRADLVVRRAVLAPEVFDLGITAYLTACAPGDPGAAAARLSDALHALADTLCPAETESQIQ